MTTWQEVSEFVGADSSDDIFVQSCLGTAQSLVDEFIGANYVPTSIRDRAVLNVGSELFHQRQAPGGVSQFASFDGAPVRIARDPMTAAYAILKPWLVIW